MSGEVASGFPSLLWAKASPDGRWLPLPIHLLDVAACAKALLGFSNCAFSHVDPSLAVFLAASHDVGKANRFFQKKDGKQAERLKGLGCDLGPSDEPARHGQATGALLALWLRSRWCWRPFEAECVAKAVGGHHGSFFSDCCDFTLSVHKEPWRTAGKEILDDLAEILGVTKPIPAPSPLNPFLGWLAGFVSVADWLGSNERMTVWKEGRGDLRQHYDEAQKRAEQLLSDLGWSPPMCTPPLSVADMLPESATSKPLQDLAAEVSRDFTLAIVEAPTGEGKTEAAFALAEPSRSQGAGVYFALPTMATANGLHKRVKAYLKRATGAENIETRLLHSSAWLFRDTAETASNPGDEGDDQEAQAQDWFAGSKRGLLAPYCVGTIDQALIAALRAKHGFVRLFALAGKVVVIDEVHAYDVYMGDLLEVLLGWLRALGCKVVMLSATLPKARREAMLRAWGFEGELKESAYPCISWITADGSSGSETFGVTPRKPLTISPLPIGNGPAWQAGADEILLCVRERGGLGALILNTVRDAQSAYKYLEGQELGEISLDLFHARFTAHDRDRIEKHIDQEYGKKAPRRGPRILVATQVVEQSLDLDFDHMVTALAPIDLLIQRAGRLHRHARSLDGQLQKDGGPDERPNPCLQVLTPDKNDLAAPNISDPVYSRDILLRTLHLLQQALEFRKPEHVSAAIEQVYSEGGRAAVTKEWEDKLKGLEAKATAKQAHSRKAADRATIEKVGNPDRLIVECTLDLDENDERAGSQLSARTRLEDRPSVTVALLQDNTTTIHGKAAEDLRSGMFACVNCSPPYPLWAAFIQIEPPIFWKRKGSLARAHPLILADRPVKVGGYEVSYSHVMGLGWKKIDANI